jgi:hypothetical protein
MVLGPIRAMHKKQVNSGKIPVGPGSRLIIMSPEATCGVFINGEVGPCGKIGVASTLSTFC